MIEVNNLTKVYKLSKNEMAKRKTKKNIKCAASGITFTAKPGEIYGLLGPNGAGKTTTLRCIATLLTPTEGEVKVCGHDTVKEGEAVREDICFLTNEIKLDPFFSPRYLFDFFGHLHGLSEEAIEARRKELFGYFGIDAFEDKKIEELSTGMKQKAAIAVSLVQDPKVVIFDEPTSGLDVITAKSVTDFLAKLKKDGKTIIVSTHIMSEAEKLCDKIGVIIDGKLVTEGTISDIVGKCGTNDLEDAFFVLYRDNHKEEE
ncbi:MAG: ABC transporter ATP-binding protein [Lachnospiraceae bacterium]|nr:ABC transporter ATP-binding protein [Lachnospiraceae bacterium]